MKKKPYVLTALSFAAALALSACGGGGGGSPTTTTAPVTPPASTGGNLQTSVAPATYTGGTMQAQAFSQLNAYRGSMGVGLLAQDTTLDTAAQAHALYLNTNIGTGAITSLSHNELSSLPNYYGDTPLSRAQKAGAPVTEWIGEDVAGGIPQADAASYAKNCLSRLLDTVYHLQDLTSSVEKIGIGFTQNSGTYVDYTCSLDFGEVTNVVGAPQANAVYIYGGQQMPTDAMAVSPLTNDTGVELAMTPETTNPAPDLANPGRPVMVRVNAASPGDVLTVSSFTLTAANGTQVPARIIVPSAALAGSTGATADVNNKFYPGVAILLPLAPLTANTTYTVSFSGARDGKAVSKTWNFTTGAS
ncbi:CAP domain-containing protein [Paraburkholderia sp. Tr-20389]|uniref:CAP domain-containing protein n=1 Tax=Paraburkholderia sp. Tr-20389 TaxID=2703903 RepID=UPI00197FBD63|nr:CAP domain-containing protein [Paraburkholderia sp. Tr-20389]MBN3754303.1 CAP domain-containing protein [Paraburkholderia sp. Tr-20389]